MDMHAHLRHALKFSKMAFTGQHYSMMFILTLSDVIGANVLGTSQDVMKCH